MRRLAVLAAIDAVISIMSFWAGHATGYVQGQHAMAAQLVCAPLHGLGVQCTWIGDQIK